MRSLLTLEGDKGSINVAKYRNFATDWFSILLDAVSFVLVSAIMRLISASFRLIVAQHFDERPSDQQLSPWALATCTDLIDLYPCPFD